MKHFLHSGYMFLSRSHCVSPQCYKSSNLSSEINNCDLKVAQFFVESWVKYGDCDESNSITIGHLGHKLFMLFFWKSPTSARKAVFQFSQYSPERPRGDWRVGGHYCLWLRRLMAPFVFFPEWDLLLMLFLMLHLALQWLHLCNSSITPLFVITGKS